MNTFDLHLLSPQAEDHLNDIVAFVGEDPSGQFSLRAHHECFITVLVPGLSRLRHADDHWDYLAQPGAVLYFADNCLTLMTRDFLRSADLHTVSRALEERFAAEDAALHDVHEQLRQLEREMLRRLWRLQRESA
jgi:F-type H+-transporting ATPase subunit epsilon